MKKFLNKTLVFATVLSVSAPAMSANIEAKNELKSTDKINSFIELVNNNADKAPFILSTHSKNSNLLFAAHGSHQSHQSHGSHASHASHQSHYSGY